ncbi:MAG TPA: 6-pyruvoyl tetrahydropterin synthase family protein [Ktedonobacteraceae bacterium]|nr:6-pyruvoyl tetrahydropterin synthase family protein [Ktedonobacteraceae bacterium]
MRKVRVEGGNLKFNAAHFITFGGGAERLHGHNYTVQIEMEGTLNQDNLVFDFSVLKRLTREVCERLNHHFILPLRNPNLVWNELPDEWEILFRQKRYLLPREDVIALPIDNSTAECLAEYICGEVCAALADYDIANIHALLVGVAEAPTQVAYYQVKLS